MGAEDGTVRIWQVTKGERLPGGDLPVHQEGVGDLTFTPDKKFLITGSSKDGEVKVWDLAKRTAVRTIKAHEGRITALAMAPDGSRFISVGQDNVVKLWETASGKPLRDWNFRVPTMAGGVFIRNVAFTPNGKQVATANANTTLYLLELP